MVLLCLAVSAAGAAPNAAERRSAEETTQPADGTAADRSFLTKGMELFAQHHALISDGILDSAAWVDSFFYDPRLEVEAQQTRVNLAFSLVTGDREGIRFDSGIRFHLSLPMLSERLKLQISDDDEDEAAIDPRRAPWPPRNPAERGLMAGLRYFFKRDPNRNSSIKLSLRMRDGAPALLFEPRYRRDYPIGDSRLRFTQRFVAYSNGDLQSRTLLLFDHPLTQWPGEILFRGVAEGIWYCERSGYFYHLDGKLLQRLGPRRGIEYAWINEFQTAPEHRLEATRLRVAYRQNVHWPWLFVEAVPQLAFTRERNWETEVGILVNLEVVFGAFDSL